MMDDEELAEKLNKSLHLTAIPLALRCQPISRAVR